MDDLDEEICKVEGRIGVRQGFISALVDEDDWSFVIKLHALLESACTEILVERVGVPSTIDIFSRMELSGHATGKVKFLRSFGIITSEQRRFIGAISELRNQLVHNVKNTNFTFDGYLDSLDANQKTKFIDGFGCLYLSDSPNKAESAPYRDEVLKKSKFIIWRSSTYILVMLGLQLETIHTERKTQKLHSFIASRSIASRAKNKKRDVH